MPNQGPTTAPKGQVDGTPNPDDTATVGTATQDPGASQTPPTVDGGQAKADDVGKSPTPTATDDVGTFFDPKDLPEELKPAYKQMQSAYTKKTQAIKGQREKIEAYDAFMQDPVTNLQSAAQQYGFRMVPVQGNPPQAGVEGKQTFGPDWQPQTYDELYGEFSQRIVQDVMQNIRQQFGPVFDNVQRLATSNVERQLSEIDPSWKVYEDEMVENLKKHPTLAHDVAALYKMTVPDEVLNSRAVQAALKKIEQKAQSAKVGDKGVTATTVPSGGKMSFQQSVDAAKEQISQRGK